MLHLWCVCRGVCCSIGAFLDVEKWAFLSQLRGYSALLRDDASSRATQLTVERLLWVVFVVFVCSAASEEQHR